jgi:hypothetical protein
MAGPAMSRDAVDQVLAGLGAGYDRIAAAMFTIDGHPGLEFLRDSALSGSTRTRWETLRPEVDLLWAHFTALGDLLEKARTLRGTRRPDDEEWVQLSRLLREPVVALDAAGMPVEQAAAPASQLYLWDLAQQLEQRCASITLRLSEVDTAWSAVAARLAPLGAAVDAFAPLAAELGEADLAERLRVRLTLAQEQDLGDPLAAAPGGRITGPARERLDELDADVAAARQRLAELAALRDGYRQRIDALGALIDGVAAAEQAVASAYARAVEKIAEPGLPPQPTAAAVLRGRVSELDRLRQAGRWSDLADDLAAVERSARRARERTGELRALADGLLERRNELRGRLDAYRAKAAGNGLAEHDDLTARYADAHDLLFTAPCDLRGSTRAVYAYQQTLATLLDNGRRESTR